MGAEGNFVNHDVGVGADLLAGYRYQFPQSRLVVGFEGEYEIANADKWGVVGTIGYALSNTSLAYVGAGYGEATYTITGYSDQTIGGAIVKAGLEQKLPWIAQGAFARGEYEYFSANEDTADIHSVKLVLGLQLGSGFTPIESLK